MCHLWPNGDPLIPCTAWLSNISFRFLFMTIIENKKQYQLWRRLLHTLEAGESFSIVPLSHIGSQGVASALLPQGKFRYAAVFPLSAVSYCIFHRITLVVL